MVFHGVDLGDIIEFNETVSVDVKFIVGLSDPGGSALVKVSLQVNVRL